MRPGCAIAGETIHLLFRQESPTVTCAEGNPGVGSSRDNEASSPWDGSESVSRRCDCQHHGGRELGVKDQGLTQVKCR